MATLALPYLYDSVVSRFLTEGPAVPGSSPTRPIPNLFGWRVPAQTITTGDRICWVPGAPESGDIGEILPARNPGGDPRSLATLEEIFHCYIHAADRTSPTAPENEMLQYIAARTLYDAWYRALYLTVRGAFRIVSNEWVIEKKERRYGATILVVVAIQAVVADEPATMMPIDTSAVIDIQELDVTETDTYVAEP